MAKKEETPKPLAVATNPEISKGTYSNLAIIHHSEHEFILDFLLKVEGDAQLVSRVILSPDHMERFIKAAGDNWNKYKEVIKKAK